MSDKDKIRQEPEIQAKERAVDPYETVNNKDPKIIYNNKAHKVERPISSLYPVIDTDLARDNIENDLSAADLQDL